MLSIQREKELSDLAEFIANKYFLDCLTDPHVLADINDISYSYNYYGSAFDGLLEYNIDSNDFHIYCNLKRVSSPTSPRARFTFCHELAHYYIDEHRNVLMGGTSLYHGSRIEYSSKLMVEQEADYFASCLLMPSIKFEKIAKKTTTGFDGIFELKQSFNTSITGTAVRYISLDIVPAVLFLWNISGSLNWSWQSDSFRNADFGFTYKKGHCPNLLRGSATERILKGKNIGEGSYLQTGTTVSAWFPRVKNMYLKNHILIEQAISLGNFGVLTLLYPDGGKFDSKVLHF